MTTPNADYVCRHCGQPVLLAERDDPHYFTPYGEGPRWVHTLRGGGDWYTVCYGRGPKTVAEPAQNDGSGASR